MGGRLWRDERKGPAKAGNPAQQAAADWTKQHIKNDYVILDRLTRQLEVQDTEHNEERDTEHLHASAICKPGWCPRASWYQLTGQERDRKARRGNVNVYAEGHEIHARHQGAIARLGVLTGNWECLVCGHFWWGTSPAECPRGTCGSKLIDYREVPIEDEDIMLLGHGDGLIEHERRGQVLLEVKSIGLGSVRIEAPAIYERFASHEVDLNAMWNSIRRPFPTHVRQTMLYLRARKLREAVILYEAKWSQQLKEFVVRFRPETIEDIVDGAHQVKRALEEGTVVRRPEWAEEKAKACKECEFRVTCWKLEDDDASEEVDEVDRDDSDGGATPVRVWKRRR